jgi:hypothetical protein
LKFTDTAKSAEKSARSNIKSSYRFSRRGFGGIFCNFCHYLFLFLPAVHHYCRPKSYIVTVYHYGFLNCSGHPGVSLGLNALFLLSQSKNFQYLMIVAKFPGFFEVECKNSLKETIFLEFGLDFYGMLRYNDKVISKWTFSSAG